MFKAREGALLQLLDAAAMGACAVSALAVLLRGKLAIALVLALCASAFLMRLTGRRQRRAAPLRLPVWVLLVNTLLSIAITIAGVEATQLPVRFDQEGFAYWHWALVLAVLVACHVLLNGLYRRLVGRRSGD